MTASNRANCATVHESVPNRRIRNKMSDTKAFLALFAFLCAILILFGVITALF